MSGVRPLVLDILRHRTRLLWGDLFYRLIDAQYLDQAKLPWEIALAEKARRSTMEEVLQQIKLSNLYAALPFQKLRRRHELWVQAWLLRGVSLHNIRLYVRPGVRAEVAKRHATLVNFCIAGPPCMSL